MSYPVKIKSNRLLINIKQMSLLKHSCILFDKETYGNLFDCLQFYDKLSEANFINDLRFDDRARSIVKNSLNSLLDDAQKEWSAVSMSDESDVDIYCTLCGTKNKHIYFIKNSISGEEINVGVNCASDFPGFLNIKEVRRDKKAEDLRQQKRKREIEFDEKISSDINFAKEASDKFESFELLLPYKIYSNLKSTIQQLNFIRTSYIENGGDIEDALIRRRKLINSFNLLWDNACNFRDKYISHPFSCPKYLSDWLLEGNKEVWEKISLNNGLLDYSTIQSVYHKKFITDHLFIFKNHISDKDINLAGISGNNIVFSIKNEDYSNEVYFMTPFKVFMQSIGANCLTNSKYVYTKADFDTRQLLQTHENLRHLLEHLIPILNSINYDIEENTKVNQYFLVKLPSTKKIGNKWSKRVQSDPTLYKPISEEWIYKISNRILFNSNDVANKILLKYLSTLSSGWKTLSEKNIYIDVAASAAAMSKPAEFIPYV